VAQNYEKKYLMERAKAILQSYRDQNIEEMVSKLLDINELMGKGIVIQENSSELMNFLI
jgi:hypothetical protein